MAAAQDVANAAAVVQGAIDANAAQLNQNGVNLGQQLGQVGDQLQDVAGAVLGAVDALNNANALQFPGGEAFRDQLSPQEIENFNNAASQIPRKEQIELESFKALQILARDRKLHRAQHLKVKMSFDQFAKVADQSKSKEVCIPPKSFLRYLAVEGRAQAIRTPAIASQLVLAVTEKYDECPAACDKETWQKKIDKAFWNAIIEGERFRADPPAPAAGAAAAAAPAPVANFTQRMTMWFELDAAAAGSFRSQFDAQCRSFQQMINIMQDEDFRDSFFKRERKNDSSSSEDSSPGRGRSSMKKKKQKKSKSESNIKKCCFHFMKGTPCSNPEKKNAKGQHCCDRGGLHPYKTSELSREEFSRVKSSKFGKQFIKKVDYFSWMVDGEYVCKPVPKDKGNKDKKKRKESSSSSSSSSEDEKSPRAGSAQQKKRK
mmetsp:Transcript_25319/g.63729  ORF Transcript_25319/g.63729 Transcript_25319/m.63729 type:complete len:431 (+) Transcript_25319:2067-3359(+)